MSHRFDIQILRGSAVIFVVLFHLNIPFFGNGFLGVDAFFVISGFLMALLYKQGKVYEFYTRRASRLLPAYFATVVATLAVSALVTLPTEHAQTVEQGLFASIFMSNVGFWAQNSYFSKAEFTPLLHLWSLGVEIQFYLIVPLLVWMFHRLRSVIILLALGALAATFLMVHISPKTAFFMMPFRIWQFLAGAGIAWYLTQAGAPRFSKPWLGLCALIIVVLIVLIYPVDGQTNNAHFGHPGLAALLITITTAAILAFGLPSFFEQSSFGFVLRKLGDWSYSIYLAHFPVIVLALYVPFSGTILSPTGWMQTGLLLVLIGLCSAVLYLVFDKPRLWSGNIKIALLLMCVTAGLSFASLPLSRMGYDQQRLNVLAAFEDRSTYRCGKLHRVLSPSAMFCELTDLPDTAPALVLIGDSHADSLKTSFAKVAQERGYRVLFTVSNAPVIAAPRSPQLLAQFRAENIKGVFVHFSNVNAFKAQTTGFAGQVREAGINIAWLLDVPTYKSSIPNMIWDFPDLGRADPKNRTDNMQLYRLLSTDKITLFDSFPAFCAERCKIRDDQMHPFYHDASHLTLTGARQLETTMHSVVDYLKTGQP